MKYIGWIVSIILVIGSYAAYRTQYVPIKRDINRLEKEIAMWENVLKGEKGLTGDGNRFPSDRFFQNNKLTPYGEVEIIRRFVLDYKNLELYISAPRALDRAADVMRFLDEQRIEYKTLRCIVVIDSAERFEYKFIK
ncbi:MAG: hypothetical protein WBB37_10600 [bacterium]